MTVERKNAHSRLAVAPPFVIRSLDHEPSKFHSFMQLEAAALRHQFRCDHAERTRDFRSHIFL